MSETKEKAESLVLMGMKGSGKTSYLAALWHLVESKEDDRTMIVPKLGPDRQYLNMIRNQWERFLPVERTSLQKPQSVSMTLSERGRSEAISIRIPDLSGEIYREQWEERHVRREFSSLAAEATGIMLFIHPTEITVSQLIEPNESTERQSTPELLWNPGMAPTQVKLVDILQSMKFLRNSEIQKVRLAIIISAWDLVVGEVLPEEWLSFKMPLLHQYLSSRIDYEDYRIYGVSALGGSLANDIDALAKLGKSSDRIHIRSNGLKDSHDLTEPLRFLWKRSLGTSENR